jgi:hypothetical protein
MDACVVCSTVKTNEEARASNIKKQVRKRYKERTKEEIHKKNPLRAWMFFCCAVGCCR